MTSQIVIDWCRLRMAQGMLRCHIALWLMSCAAQACHARDIQLLKHPESTLMVRKTRCM